MQFRFGHFVLDTQRQELRRGDERIALERRVFAFLALLLEPLAGDFRHPSTDARLALAWMTALQGRHDEASEWFAEARAVLDAQGARPLRAITDFEEARMLARRGDPGDAERALLRIDAAVRRFESIGMPGWVSRAQALRSDLEGR